MGIQKSKKSSGKRRMKDRSLRRFEDVEEGYSSIKYSPSLSTVLGNLVWVLPRPRLTIEEGRKSYYRGGFPLHFEKRLFRLLGKPSLILHSFGGKAEIGIRVDLKKEVKPDVIGDAHFLPFRDSCFGAVICDPPYSDKENKDLYDVSLPLKFGLWCKEAERVLEKNGFLVLYHDRWLPRPKSCCYWMRILVLVSQHHRARIAGIFQKET